MPLGLRFLALDVEGVLELLDLAVELLGELVRQVAALPDLLVDLALGAEVLTQLVLEPCDLRRRDVVEVALVAGVDRGDLRLHRRQRREGAAAQLLVELAGALEQARVEIEDVARERLPSRRAAQQQRELAIRVGMLREVVVHDERVLAVEEEVLAHRTAGERRHPFDRSSLARRSRHDGRVLHGAGVAQALVDPRDRRLLLADGDVDAVHVRVPLVEDRVDEDRRLSRRAVADDQLALTTADVRHRVDRLDAGGERLLHRLALDHAGRLELERPALVRLDRAAPVERVAERVDDPAKQRLADGDARDGAGAAHGLALAHLLPLAEERDSDLVLLEVEREADDAVLELEHLQRETVLEPVHARDAVTDLQDGADLGEVGLDVELLDPLFEDRRDLFGAKLHGFTN